LKQQWQAFQQDKVNKIHAWYVEHYEHAYVDDPLIKYIVLWSVFNALYNVYDVPNNKLPEKMQGRYKFKKRFGYMVPIIIVARDSDRIKKFAKKLASLESLVDIVHHDNMRNQINAFVNRIPAVAQREGADLTEQVPIVYKNEDGEWVEDLFSPTAIHGVASLDHRLFLANGYKFFEYAAIQSPWNEKGDLIDLDITAKQLLNVLYQLRNNVVHGGVVSDKRKSIISDALPILQKFVEFVFATVDQIYTGERE
jgi:hypothetical protein